MRKIAIAILMLLISAPAWSQTADYDPLARNLIFVEGQAEIDVPINGFRLTFDFDIERGSFENAMQDSESIIEMIQNQVNILGLTKVEFIKGWDIVRQAAISLGSKGRKISNRLTIQVTDYPKEQLHQLLAKIIDAGISVDKAVTLQDMSVFVSDEVEAQKQGEVLFTALKSLNSNAIKAAEAVGKKIKSPKRVFVTNQQSVNQNNAYAGYDNYSHELAAYKTNSFVSIQKSFKVQGAIVDSIKIKANVSGIYEIE